MNTIRILPEKVASQIAAGEVIERPASVVRELIDNSIDAKAHRISVKIERGGKGLIKVTDNGIGMGRDDLLLCFERHATSKIRTASDLVKVTSFGFRGKPSPAWRRCPACRSHPYRKRSSWETGSGYRVENC